MADLSTFLFLASIGCLGLAILQIIRAQSNFSRLEVAEHCSISPEHPHLPDAAIEDEKPIVFKVTDRKNLYLQPISGARLKVYIDRYAQFLMHTHNLSSALRLVAYSDSAEVKAKILGEWQRTLYDKQTARLQRRLIRDVFLKDKAMNPDRVTIREIEAMPWTKIILLWQLGYDRNVNAVEDFTRSLMTSLSGRANAKAGSGSPGSASISTDSVKPRYPGKGSGCAASPSGTSESPTNTKQTIETEGDKP